jgi:hypothetical protein
MTNHVELLPSLELAASEQPGERLHADIMIMYKYHFLVTVDDFTGFPSVVFLPKKDTYTLTHTMLNIIAWYRSHTFLTNFIDTDCESNFRACEPFMNATGVKMRFSAPGAKNRVAERFIRTMKERVRTHLRPLLTKYASIPATMFMSLVQVCANAIARSPNVKTSYNTPAYIITKELDDVAAFPLQHSIGDVAFFHKNHGGPKLSVHESNGEEGVALHAHTSVKNSLVVLSLRTGRTFISTRATPLVFSTLHRELVQKMPHQILLHMVDKELKPQTLSATRGPSSVNVMPDGHVLAHKADDLAATRAEPVQAISVAPAQAQGQAQQPVASPPQQMNVTPRVSSCPWEKD